MDFRKELHKGFSELLKMLQENNETNILLMSYPEYSLQLYILCYGSFFNGLLHESSPLAQAFCEIGIDQPRDQFIIFLDAFYLYWHTQEASFQ